MIRIAYFGAGCFWNSEKIYSKHPGVVETEVGWALFPNNETKGSVEVVKVKFNSSITNYEELIDLFWSTHNPANKKNQDQSYVERSVLLYVGDQQKAAAEKKMAEKLAQSEIYTTIDQFKSYKRAPEKDQKYYEKNI